MSCHRVKAYHQRSAQYDQILKKNEQMYALLAITTSLCPASQRNVDEAVLNTLKEKWVLQPLDAYNGYSTCLERLELST